jgi:hypothetical protein
MSGETKEVAKNVQIVKEQPLNKCAKYNDAALKVVVFLILCVIVYAYIQFQKNKESDDSCEQFINGSPRTDPQTDKSYDIYSEVDSLIKSQEEYLEKIQRQRLDN